MAWLIFADTEQLIQRIKDIIVSETQEAVDAITAKLTKVLGEVVNATDALRAEIEALKAQVAAGQTVDLSGLEAVAESLDELNEDAAEPEPGEG